MNNVSFPALGLEFMMSETISIFGVRIYWYAVIIVLGMLTAVALAHFEFRKKGIDPELLTDFALIALPLGVVGARCYYVIFEWSYYSKHPEDIIAIWEGGLAVYGGIIAGAIAAVIFTKMKKIDFLWFADVACMGLFIAQSMGRWGNFINAEAYGSVTNLPWGMMVNGSGPHHPTFFYESMWNLLGFLVAYFIIRRLARRDGFSFAYYLIWYGIGRFFIEGLRTDSLYLTGNIRVSQLVAVISVAIGIGVLVYILRREKANIE